MPRKKTKKEVVEILDKLVEAHPDAHCELVHSSPFELLVATMLSAPCTDVRVNMVPEEMFKTYPRPDDFQHLAIKEIEAMIKTCGLYKSKAKNIKAASSILVDKYSGRVPDVLEELVSLPGVGRKTADVVLSNAFGIPAIAVDTHVFRVSNRIGFVKETTVEATEFALMKCIPKDRWTHSHHLLIFQGRRICRSEEHTSELQSRQYLVCRLLLEKK